jgi:hypothetical protein
MSVEIDVVVLSRDKSPLRPEIERGLWTQNQDGLEMRLHRVIGAPLPGDSDRWVTIARARNEGLARASSSWVMYLDDDVVLSPSCVRRLLEGLHERPGHAALAADYLGESKAHGPWSRPDPHVAMGATLFRRRALGLIRFRSQPGRCECQCCCDDLRRLGLAIAYLPEARARHDPIRSNGHATGHSHVLSTLSPSRGLTGRVLAAFDRRHLERFRRLFLGSLRAFGNEEPVTAVGYGLYPSEQRALARARGIELVSLSASQGRPPVRRLRDFQNVLARWPEAARVAYWDAGDVVFQGSLGPLWDLVAAHPDRLLAVREPVGYPTNPAVRAWTTSIHDPVFRRQAFALLSSRPFLNSGFAAGTARAMLAYFREADRLLHSPALRGTTDWGDQTALNLYCHTDPNRWQEIAEGWNFCVHDRRHGEVSIGADGRIRSAKGTPIHVAHGNAFSLPQLVLSRRFA